MDKTISALVLSVLVGSMIFGMIGMVSADTNMIYGNIVLYENKEVYFFKLLDTSGEVKINLDGINEGSVTGQITDEFAFYPTAIPFELSSSNKDLNSSSSDFKLHFLSGYPSPADNSFATIDSNYYPCINKLLLNENQPIELKDYASGDFNKTWVVELEEVNSGDSVNLKFNHDGKIIEKIFKNREAIQLKEWVGWYSLAVFKIYYSAKDTVNSKIELCLPPSFKVYSEEDEHNDAAQGGPVCGNGICEYEGECPEDCNNTETGCKNLYWFDDTTKVCGQKQFCGTYLRPGLYTFSSKEQCEKALNESKINKSENSCLVDSDCDYVWFAGGCYTPEYIAQKQKEAEEKGMNIGEAEPKENISCVCKDNKCKSAITLSNGRKAEIKIMPETASATAIAKLGDLGFTIELKEVGKGDNAKPVYELTGKKQGKFLGIFKIMASEKIQVDAETGEVKKVIKPWWSFLATNI